ncbi:DUF305 domain-containing protein [Stutzerimonas zhaodongensis]|uniref:DUF305 domain-containing protein n=2 Tax=Pseudomonadales TaxID=72274 RepID=A0A365PZ60_9GAMM|nr:DUF305 domain-containing protein [Stutzerimonas zhaodongensis]
MSRGSLRRYIPTGINTMASYSLRRVGFLGATALLTGALISAPTQAAGPGNGRTAPFEQSYLKFIIDHHFSALRMTELAAGTDVQRDPQVNNPREGTAPTPSTAATPAKASAEEIKSMARMANRSQREEIAKAQRFLLEWYGVAHVPQVTPAGQRAIQALTYESPGAQFDRAFLANFSNHHYLALGPSQECRVKFDLKHEELKHYCEGIVQTQTRQINDMRAQLCERFNVCDYQPYNPITRR